MGFLDSTSTQTNAPWKPAQPYIMAGMKKAAGLLKNKAGFKVPGFDTFAPMSDQTTQGLGSIWGAAQGGNPLAGQSESAISGILGGTPGSNPAFEADLNNQAQRTADDVQRQFSGLGRIGSGADTGVLTDRIGQLRTGAMANQYNQDIAQRLQAVGQAGEAYGQRFLPGQAMGQVGQAYDDLAARQIQAKLDKFNTKTQAPWNRLNAYNGAISGTGGNSGYGQQTVSQPFNWAGALGGLGLAGASLFGGGGLSRL